ncbi:MAG: hypothetical protein JW829_01095 [Pirellulales bacterium]|nr:hypothetical protein [Pirellulales bacterium]
MAQHHQIRSYHHAAQARWLAESGLRRAVARRAGNSEYLGELWIIPPGALSQHRGGRVEIQVEPAPNGSDSLRITARAEYPDDAIYRVRRTESIIVPHSAFSLIEFNKRQEVHPVGARSGDRAPTQLYRGETDAP